GYNEAGNSWTNITDLGGTVARTAGYILKPVSGNKTYTFAGIFNTGTISTGALNVTGSGFHLVSNPYPSPINLHNL
ncbi:MAG: hypothetical protein J0653_08205, partial [Deltaproteobacteria bacterium]|nr:hypothetical protein [Deltaproteobacteria bacterium]